MFNIHFKYKRRRTNSFSNVTSNTGYSEIDGTLIKIDNFEIKKKKSWCHET